MRFPSLRTWILAAAVPLGFAATIALGGDKETDDGLDVWYRDADLSALSDAPATVYVADEAGESTLVDRAFPGAPPSIPHTTDGMLPIFGDENECLECHHPDNTMSKKDAPVPESHFHEAVLGVGEGSSQEGMLWTVKGYSKADDVSGARYNCVMCHTPLATGVPVMDTTFEVVLLAHDAPAPVEEPAPKKKKKKKKR